MAGYKLQAKEQYLCIENSSRTENGSWYNPAAIIIVKLYYCFLLGFILLSQCATQLLLSSIIRAGYKN